MKKKSFITDSFLLENKQAEELYHNYAKKQPIIDYHNHLPPREIAADHNFENLTQLWLANDHYKWRAMRAVGIDEEFIAGNGSDKQKFEAWAKTVPHTLRNPLYHWAHLELKRYYDIDELLSESNAAEIYNHVNKQLQRPEYSCRSLLKMMNVESLCTTEDPTDTLEHHQALHKENSAITVSTAFRPDKALSIEAEGYYDYLNALGAAADITIVSYDNLKQALRARINFFHQNGCRLCDHGMSAMPFQEYTESEVSSLFSKRQNGGHLTPVECEKYKTAVLTFLCETYSELGWVQQFHLGPLRNNNKRKLAQLGPDTGWDSIGDFSQAKTLSNFLNSLDSKDKLTKTIIYNLNPADNAVFAAMIGNFNDGSVRGKVQYGSGWWFLDQKDGIVNQLNALSNMGLVSCFVGMLTDSRSFMSFPRHEYFRRILCNLFGKEMQNGELPDEMELVGQTIANISYHNAKNYFDF